MRKRSSSQPQLVRKENRMLGDPTLAFSALMELDPAFPSTPEPQAGVRVAELAAAMTKESPPDRWKFARQWIADHPSIPPRSGLSPEEVAASAGPLYSEKAAQIRNLLPVPEENNDQ